MPRGRPRKNAQVAMNALPPTSAILDESKPKEHGEPRDMQAFLGEAAEIAKSTICVRNWQIKNSRKHFPFSPLMRTVDKYFQYAEGGPLYVDEPVDKQSLRECEEKRRVMDIEGLRYVILPKFEQADQEGGFLIGMG